MDHSRTSSLATPTPPSGAPRPADTSPSAHPGSGPLSSTRTSLAPGPAPRDGDPAAAADRPSGPLALAWGVDARRGRLAELLAGGLGSHPVRPSTDRASWSGLDRATVAAFVARAEPDLGQPWPQPLTSHYAQFLREGRRTAYEGRVAERQARLSRAAVLATATGELRWLDEVVDGVVLLCEQSSWCWAAHDEGVRHHGWALPPAGSPTIDLGAAEVVGQLAWVDHVLGAALDERAPGVRERMHAEARTRVLRPFVERRDWHWLGRDDWAHSWNPWIHGHLLVAALVLLHEPAERAEVAEHVIEGLDRFLSRLPEDGSTDAGYGSWWDGAGRTLEALELLAHASGGVLDARDVPVVRETVRFPHRMQLGGDWYLGVGDSPARPPRDQAWHVLHRWACAIGDDDAQRHAASYREPGLPSVTERAGLGRALLGLADPSWREVSAGRPPLVREAWLPGTQVAVARERVGSARGLCLTVKGGHNGENGNHNDVGSVVVAVDGVPLVVDAGQPTSTAATFGVERYTLWTMQSGWHNVPEPAWTPQGTGPQFRARDMRVTHADDRTHVQLDLSEAYDLPGAVGLRTATLDRRRRTVTVEDRWQLGPSGGPDDPPPGLRVHYLLAGDVVASEPGTLTTRPAGGGRGVRLTWDRSDVTVTTTVRPLDDPLLAAVWGEQLTRLELTCTAAADADGESGSGVVRVRVTVQAMR